MTSDHQHLHPTGEYFAAQRDLLLAAFARLPPALAEAINTATILQAPGYYITSKGGVDRSKTHARHMHQTLALALTIAEAGLTLAEQDDLVREWSDHFTAQLKRNHSGAGSAERTANTERLKALLRQSIAKETDS